LDEAAEQKWQTPTGSMMPSRRQVGAAEREALLPDQAKNWPTPQARGVKNPDSPDSGNYQRKQARGFTIDLNSTAANWQTPGADSFRSRGGDRKGEMGLGQQARLGNWATPMAMDGVKPSAGKRALADLSHQAQAHTTIGPKCSPQTRRLNPLFVEWLMGFPRGWTDCGALGMQSFRSWRHAHLFSLRRGLESEADQ
jgi:hypothetical protein